MTTISWTDAMNSKNSEDPSLFVLNRSKPKQQLLISVDASDPKNPVAVTVPRTWIPVDIAIQADRDKVLRAPGLRNLCEQGVMVIVSTKEARELFAINKLAQTERLRLRQGHGATKVQLDNDPAARVNVEAPASSEQTVNPSVADLILHLNAGSRTGDDVCALLASVDLTEIDVQYILQHAQDEAVRAFAANWTI